MALKAISVIVALYASVWAFNHINPWLGIATMIATIYITVKQIIKQSNQNEKK